MARPAWPGRRARQACPAGAKLGESGEWSVDVKGGDRRRGNQPTGKTARGERDAGGEEAGRPAGPGHPPTP